MRSYRCEEKTFFRHCRNFIKSFINHNHDNTKTHPQCVNQQVTTACKATARTFPHNIRWRPQLTSWNWWMTIFPNLRHPSRPNSHRRSLFVLFYVALLYLCVFVYLIWFIIYLFFSGVYHLWTLALLQFFRGSAVSPLFALPASSHVLSSFPAQPPCLPLFSPPPPSRTPALRHHSYASPPTPCFSSHNSPPFPPGYHSTPQPAPLIRGEPY